MTIRSKINGLKEIWHFDNRWQLICSRLFFSAEPIDVYRYRGMDILVDHSAGDANGAREILISRMYRQFLEPLRFTAPVTVLDLGANNGGFPLLLHALGIPIKKVVSVELNPNTFSRLRFNLERNLRCEFTALNIGVCGENRELEVTLGSGGAGDNIYQPHAASGPASSNGSKVYRLPGRTLDDIFATALGSDRVDICKMDIEAAEYEVFETPHHQGLAKCRYLIIEIHDRPDRDPQPIYDELTRFGFGEIERTDSSDPNVHCFVNQRFASI
jgi:FkbM family methyltransferase